MRGLPNGFALAAGTDGVDRAEEVTGAIAPPDTLARALALGLSPQARLADNDGHGFFAALGDQVITGPALTNFNDFLRDPGALKGGLLPVADRHRSASPPRRRAKRRGSGYWVSFRPGGDDTPRRVFPAPSVWIASSLALRVLTEKRGVWVDVNVRCLFPPRGAAVALRR